MAVQEEMERTRREMEELNIQQKEIDQIRIKEEEAKREKEMEVLRRRFLD